MEKKNTILLTVVAIATLLVAIVGATFAYFAGTGSTNVENAVNVVATTHAVASEFITTGGDLELDVAAADMLEAAKGQAEAVATDNKTLSVSFLAKTTDAITCTYDLSYTWEGTADTNKYVKNGDKEFTYKVTGTGTGAYTGNSTEANFDAYDGTTFAPVKLGSATITNADETTATVHNYDVEINFYNLVADQTNNAGKNLKVKFYVDNVNCEKAS